METSAPEAGEARYLFGDDDRWGDGLRVGEEIQRGNALERGIPELGLQSGDPQHERGSWPVFFGPVERLQALWHLHGGRHALHENIPAAKLAVTRGDQPCIDRPHL